MVNIWLKAYTDNKMVLQKTLKMFQPYSRTLLEEMIKIMLEQLDLPAPVFLDSHFANFEKFRCAKFLQRDFVESVPFDSVDIVDIS